MTTGRDKGDLTYEELKAMQARVVQQAKEMIEQWNGLGALLEAGLLIKQSRGWYRIADPKAMDRVSTIVRTIAPDRSGKIDRIQFEKPTRSLYAIAGIPYTPPTSRGRPIRGPRRGG